MAPVKVDPDKVPELKNAEGFYHWLNKDLEAAIHAEPKARAMLEKLNAQNRVALAFRTHNMKTEAGRKKKIEAFVGMLKRGETIYPQRKK